MDNKAEPLQKHHSSHAHLPEHPVQHCEEDGHATCPEHRPLVDWILLLARNGGTSPDKACKFRGWFGCCEEAHGHSDQYANQEGPECAIKILGHILRVRRKRDIAEVGWVHFYQREHGNRGSGACEHSPETSFGRSPSPHHSCNYSAEERSDEEADQRLHVIHDAVELSYEIGGTDTEKHTQDGAPAADFDIVRV